MTTPEIIQVLQAHERGEKIERKSAGGTDRLWNPDRSPSWDFYHYDYRVAQYPTPIPLTPADVPPGSVVRKIGWAPDLWKGISTVTNLGAVVTALNEGELCLSMLAWEELAADWQILRPGGVWEAASKIS